MRPTSLLPLGAASSISDCREGQLTGAIQWGLWQPEKLPSLPRETKALISLQAVARVGEGRIRKWAVPFQLLPPHSPGTSGLLTTLPPNRAGACGWWETLSVNPGTSGP